MTQDSVVTDGMQAGRYTERELAVLCLTAAGFTNSGIAARLHISRHTVAQHIAEMLRATGARSRAELVARAYCDGILPTGDWPPSPPAATTRTPVPHVVRQIRRT